MNLRRPVPSCPLVAGSAPTCLLVATLAAFGSTASAQTAPATTPPTTTATAATVPTASAYALAIREGYEKLLAADPTGAQIAFQRATTADPTKSEGVYLLGVAMLQNQSRAPALDAFRRATELAVAAHDPLGEGRARSALARALASSVGTGGPGAAPATAAEIDAAYAALVQFATAHPAILDPALPRADQEALSRFRARDAEQAAVRTRIANREREVNHGSGHSRH